MNLRTPRRLTVLALVASAVTVLPTAGPAAATRPDVVSPAYSVDEWTSLGDLTRLPPEPYKRVEVTYNATYGITLDGQVRTSVPSGNPQALIAPEFDEPIVDVTAGSTFGLALDDQGHLHSWGLRPTIPGDDLTETYRDVAATSGSAIGVTTDGELRFWGHAAVNYVFDPDALADADIVSVDLDSSAAVAVTADGHVLSGGGAITGEWDPAWTFPADRADETFVAADAGTEFALGLTDAGDVVAWGVDDHEQLDVPEFPAGRHAVAVSAGMWMAAAVLDDGSVVRWGEGESTVIPTQRAGLPVADIDLDRYRVAVTYAALASTSAPTISGTPQFGETLTATPGEWSSEPDEVHYEWRAHDRNGTDSEVVGTDSATYSPSADDAWDGVTISVTVTAKAAGFVDGSAVSDETGSVTQRQFTTAPTLTMTGVAQVGRTLTATATDSVPASDAGEWTWFTVVRGDDPDGSDDDVSPIDGAASGSLTVTPDLVGKTVFANLTLTKEGYVPTFGETDDVVIAPGALVSTSAPTISGTPQFGQTLTATPGEWSSEPDEVHYEWRAHHGTDSEFVGTDSATYSPTASDARDGVTISVTVTAGAAGFVDGSATSDETQTVAQRALTVPTIEVTGKARVGQTLTATATVDPASTSSYQWLRGSAPIAGATALSYRPVAADLGKALQVRVTTTATGYTTSTVTSAATAPVTLGATKLKVSVPRKTTVGKKAAITVRGLAAGERFKVTVGAKRISGKATRAGVGKVKVKITGKPGKRAVKVVGSVADRAGKGTLRVVRRR